MQKAKAISNIITKGKTEDVIRDIKGDIKRGAQGNRNWDALAVLLVEKFGKEVRVKTEKGDVFMSARAFVQQGEFRNVIFEALSIRLPRIKARDFDELLDEWTSPERFKDLWSDDPDIADTTEKLIVEFLEDTFEPDIRYVRLGRPVLRDGKEVVFRSKDVVAKLKSEGLTVTSDQVFFVLRRIGCQPKTIEGSLRVWVWQKPDVEGEKDVVNKG